MVLHEYLSFNWKNLDDVYEANQHLLREDGLMCTWIKSTVRFLPASAASLLQPQAQYQPRAACIGRRPAAAGSERCLSTPRLATTSMRRG